MRAACRPSSCVSSYSFFQVLWHFLKEFASAHFERQVQVSPVSHRRVPTPPPPPPRPPRLPPAPPSLVVAGAVVAAETMVPSHCTHVAVPTGVCLGGTPGGNGPALDVAGHCAQLHPGGSSTMWSGWHCHLSSGDSCRRVRAGSATAEWADWTHS